MKLSKEIMINMLETGNTNLTEPDRKSIVECMNYLAGKDVAVVKLLEHENYLMGVASLIRDENGQIYIMVDMLDKGRSIEKLNTREAMHILINEVARTCQESEGKNDKCNI